MIMMATISDRTLSDTDGDVDVGVTGRGAKLIGLRSGDRHGASHVVGADPLPQLVRQVEPHEVWVTREPG